MSTPQPFLDDDGCLFKAIDAMLEQVNRFRSDPAFESWVEERVACVPRFESTDDELLGRFITLIAYSNNAQANLVTRMVELGVLRKVFQDYSVEKVSVLQPEQVLKQHWQAIQAMRFKYKVDAMVRCAQCLLLIRKQHGSFMTYLAGMGLPGAIKSDADILSFWTAFGRLRAYLWELDFPYFQNLTSLCHLLMDIGFDCAKPDLAVMKAAVDLGIVAPPAKQKKNPEKSRGHSEEALRRTVQAIQAYAISRNTRPSIIDLYFLIRGGQTGVRHLVKAGYPFLA